MLTTEKQTSKEIRIFISKDANKPSPIFILMKYSKATILIGKNL